MLHKVGRELITKYYTSPRDSKSSEAIGTGIAGPRTKLEGRFPHIFHAKVFAISRCVEIKLQRNYRNVGIAIFSYSQAALKVYSAYEIKSLLVQECYTPSVCTAEQPISLQPRKPYLDAES